MRRRTAALILLLCFCILQLTACNSRAESATSAHPGDSYYHLSGSDTVRDVLEHPALQGFSQYILTSGRSTMWHLDDTLDNVNALLPYHSHIDPETTVASINYLIDEVRDGRKLFYRYYEDTESEKELTGLIFLRGQPGAPFAVISPGGGFSYNGAVHEGFPYAMELVKRGYNAFILFYRLRGGVSAGQQPASEDLAAAVSWIISHSEELEVDPAGYSLWGSSAGAIISSNVGSHGPSYYGYEVPRPAAVVMAYTRYTYFFTDAPPTFVTISDDDPIVMGGPARVDEAVEAMRQAGVEVRYQRYHGLGHGYGPGIGTEAEGWVSDAIDFWQALLDRSKE